MFSINEPHYCFSAITQPMTRFYVIFSHFDVPSWRGKTWALHFEPKIDQADVADWISFLPSNLLEKIIPNS